ncbi:MAG: DUF4443 domain-containing protein [Candidatus Asgardarchaeum sp.]
MSFKSPLKNLIEMIENFCRTHPQLKPYLIFQSIYEIGSKSRIGRYSLSKEIGLSESTARTLLKFLKREGLIISIPKSGHRLSNVGLEIFEHLKKYIGSVKEIEELEEFRPAKYAIGILIRGASKYIKKGLEERDDAVRAGAKGATIIVYERNTFSVPSVYPELVGEEKNILIKIFSPSDGDVIAIVFADNRSSVKQAAFAVAYYLLKRKLGVK